MKISGFTFIKNALIYDYPIVEAIKSILPICDEFIVAVGKSDDETLKLINQIDHNKIKIVETQWDESLRLGGRVLAAETDKAFSNISEYSDWGFYIQGDEVVHEKYLDTIYEAMLKYKDEDKIDGLLFKYLHFYGSYSYVGASSNWYQNEIRVVKNDKSIYSYKDAQGFRKKDNEKLRVCPIDAYIYHYGWVKDPKAMQRKQENFNKFWHNDEWINDNIQKASEFNYNKAVSELKKFTGEHPKIMKKRINEKNWKFDYDIAYDKRSLKDKIKQFLKKYFGIDIGYKNYRITIKKHT
jgi:ribosomal protein S18